MKIAVIGCGLYSMAFTSWLMQKENQIYVWTEQEKLVTKFQKTHKFEPLSRSMVFKDNVILSNSISDVLYQADMIFIMVGSQFFETTIQAMKPYYLTKTPILVGTKGMNTKTVTFFSDFTQKVLECRSYSFFAGPTFAKEMIQTNKGALTVAGTNKKGFHALQSVLPSSIYLEYSNDLYGLELMSILKNIFALGAGVLTGLKASSGLYYQYETKALYETKLFLQRFYGLDETILTYGGIGDFLMTSHSKLSRNFTLGKMFGEGKSEEEIKKYLKDNTVEGYVLLEDFYQINKKVNSTLMECLYKIFYVGLDPENLTNL